MADARCLPRGGHRGAWKRPLVCGPVPVQRAPPQSPGQLPSNLSSPLVMITSPHPLLMCPHLSFAALLPSLTCAPPTSAPPTSQRSPPSLSAPVICWPPTHQDARPPCQILSLARPRVRARRGGRLPCPPRALRLLCAADGARAQLLPAMPPSPPVTEPLLPPPLTQRYWGSPETRNIHMMSSIASRALRART